MNTNNCKFLIQTAQTYLDAKRRLKGLHIDYAERFLKCLILQLSAKGYEPAEIEDAGSQVAEELGWWVARLIKAEPEQKEPERPWLGWSFNTEASRHEASKLQ